jgi:hypothetical protein
LNCARIEKMNNLSQPSKCNPVSWQHQVACWLPTAMIYCTYLFYLPLLCWS